MPRATESDKSSPLPIGPLRTAEPGAGPLRVLCAGAAQGFLTRYAAEVGDRHGPEIMARFSAVGALRDALLGGEECDVLIVTETMVSELCAAGHVAADSKVVLGQVGTGIAVRRGEPKPDVCDAAALAQALRTSSAIHLPDPLRATAGVHFTGVMRRLGLLDALADRLRTYPNGATAMRALAGSTGPGQLGCTQMSEIMFAEGVELVAGLPRGFELNTSYAAVVTSATNQPDAARALVSNLGATTLADLRVECGIDAPPRG